MNHDFFRVVVIDREPGSCKPLVDTLEAHDFRVDHSFDFEQAKDMVRNLAEPVFVFLHLPNNSFDAWIEKGKQFSEIPNAILIYVLEKVDKVRFQTIRKHNPYGFTTTDSDPYSLFQTLYFAARLFEEQSSANRLKKEVETELNTLATTFQSTTGTELFKKVCKHLALSLDIDYAFIGEISDGREVVKVLGAYGEGKFLEPFEYDLAHTPCENVAGQEGCHYVSGVQDLYPKDELLKRMGIEGYIGIPLFSSSEKPLGITVLMHKKPLEDVQRYQRYLQIYSDRVAAEIERKRAENELREREQELRSINEHISEGIYRSTPNDGLVYVNEAFALMFGYDTPKELLEVKAPKLYADEKRRQEITEIENRQGYIKNMEVEFRRKDGSTFWGLMSGKVVNDAEGNVQYYDGSVLDITDRKHSEELLKQSLKEKEILLAEIHHRVKNNMAIISGLLELEAMNRESDTELKNIFHESQLRIHSMAMIHEKLYQAGNFTNLKIGNYISELVDIIQDTLGQNEKQIDIRIEKEFDVQLNINQAIPCALILNELVTNAIKYAFNDTNQGTLHICLEEKNDMITFRLKDNGPGLPEGIAEKPPNSLGFVLVKQLTKQLEGELNMYNDDGACFEITFRRNDKSGPASSGYIIDRNQR